MIAKLVQVISRVRKLILAHYECYCLLWIKEIIDSYAHIFFPCIICINFKVGRYFARWQEIFWFHPTQFNVLWFNLTQHTYWHCTKRRPFSNLDSYPWGTFTAHIDVNPCEVDLDYKALIILALIINPDD